MDGRLGTRRATETHQSGELEDADPVGYDMLVYLPGVRLARA